MTADIGWIVRTSLVGSAGEPNALARLQGNHIRVCGAAANHQLLHCQLQRSLAARAPVVNGEGAVAELLRRDQLKPSRTGQPVLVQGRAVAGDLQAAFQSFRQLCQVRPDLAQ